MYVKRHITTELERLSKEYPVITLTGPRQSGKTTLIRNVFSKKPYYNLEEPEVRRLKTQDPKAFLKPLTEGAIFDEIQNYEYKIEDLRYKKSFFWQDYGKKPRIYWKSAPPPLFLAETIQKSFNEKSIFLNKNHFYR